MIKHKLYSLSLLIAMALPLGAAEQSFEQAKAEEQTFKMSDEEIKMLNLNEKEAKELKEFFEELNKLTPEQRKALQRTGKDASALIRTMDWDSNKQT